ncbi:MAG: DNA repair protein RadC [Calditrichaeota bacterium]|nr:DNA repair protein RadC [Candidatus Cloacimonadota bacterium]MCA9785095.1 DNA repair protein RadC [Candidatus Cloacimonadota bacterium]MCB1047877.1 DNA repair protein RadC [Calditrichota bacterium]MCB9472773.1 DNA repair protein RadC [Candidatus Delongbacteria bacterium]
MPQATPREKLIAAGPAALSLPELIAVILSAGTRKESVFEIGRRIAEEYGVRSISALGSVHEMMGAYGIGRARACQLSAALELGRRLFDPGSGEFPVLRNPRDTARYLDGMARLSREQFRCLYLNTVNRVIRDEIISIGSLNASLVHPREVFHYAIHYSAASLLLAHNHPGGSLEPSREDLQLTRQLLAVSRVMGIPILDHLIIGPTGWFSFQEHGLLTEAPGL